MFKKREYAKTNKTNGNVQFYVGAAVGITAGLCLGKLLSSTTSNKTSVPAREFTTNIPEDDNISVNKKRLNNVRSKSASWREDKNVENSTLKAVSSDSEIDINSPIPKKLQSDEVLRIRNSYWITQESNVSIFTDSTLKLDTQDTYQKNIDSALERPGVDYLSDKENILSNDTNEATCNTIVDVNFEQENLTSTQNGYESFDIQYDEFAERSLLSSTKYNSIPF